MRKSIMLAIFTALFLALVPVAVADKEPPPPDMSKVIRLIGAFGMGHACPIAPKLAITAAHVVDLDPLKWMPLLSMRFEAIAGVSGYADPAGRSYAEDVAILELSDPVRYYKVAAEAPGDGEYVFWMGYDLSNRKDAGRPVVFSARVSRTVAGHIWVDESTLKGASGSCVLDAREEVVGLVSFKLPVGPITRLDSGIYEQDSVMLGVGVWGKWLPPVAGIERSLKRAAPAKKEDEVQP